MTAAPLEEALDENSEGKTAFPSPPPVELPAGIFKETLQAPPPRARPRFPRACRFWPAAGDELRVEYTGRLWDTATSSTGDVVDCSAEDEPVLVTLGKGETIKGWDWALQTMQTGEVARFWIEPEHAYADKGLGAIPANVTIVFDLTLVSWSCPDDLYGDWGCIRRILDAGAARSSPVSCYTTDDDNKEIATEVELSLRTSSGSDGRILEEVPPRSYRLGSGELGRISSVVDKALLDMKKGERIELRCQPEYVNGGCHVDEEEMEEVYADLALYEIFQDTDVSFDKDRSVMRKRIVEGDGPALTDGGRVRLIVEAVVDGDGEAVAAYDKEGFNVTFFVGEGEVCDALECAVLDMSKGERAIVTCTRPDMCVPPPKDRKPGVFSGAAENQVMKFTILLDDFENFGNPWEMNKSDLVAFSTQRKEIGSELFAKGRIVLAQERYRGVMELISDCHEWRTVSAKIRDGAKALRLVCCSNMAQCQLKRGDFLGCKGSCDKILRDDPRHVKALFRRASACLSRGECAEAEKDLHKLLAVEPKNVEARKLLVRAGQDTQKGEKESKPLFAKMGQGLIAETAPKTTPAH